MCRPYQGSMFLRSEPRVSELTSLAFPPWALFFRAFGAPFQLKSQGSEANSGYPLFAASPLEAKRQGEGLKSRSILIL
jgi:hypothetical protein